MPARLVIVLLALAGPLVAAPTAEATGWLPHPAGASWTWQWQDTKYSSGPTTETISVLDGADKPTFKLAWTQDGQTETAELCGVKKATFTGTVTLQTTDYGIKNVDWCSLPPPPQFPVLCAQAGGCPNTLASAWYLAIWGARDPLLAEPLIRGATWASSGGAQNDVTSTSTYVGSEQVAVPAFPMPVTAAKVRTEIAQAGALGDPYGSGVRTVWWVHGVGPVKIVFAHAGGIDAAVTTAMLQATNQTPTPTPPDANYFPLTKDSKLTYRWTNSRYLKKPSVQQAVVDAVAGSTARFSLKSVRGPIRVAGAYLFASKLDGLTNIAANTSAATLAKFPPLGPRALPTTRRRHFFTPFDLMNFGINPVLTAYVQAGDRWTVAPGSRDFEVFGAQATSTVLGIQRVTVPAGTFRALAVRTTLRQPGFPFGSGTRTSWFAAGKGLVKLVFRHGDGSTSVVDLLR